jgi:hypothetical protein
VQSGSLLPTFCKQEVHSERVIQLPSKLKPQSGRLHKILSFIVSVVRTQNPLHYVFCCTQSLVSFLTDLGKYSQLDTGTLVRNMLYH